MAYILSKLLRDVLDDGLGQMISFRATGGSATTAQDTNANGRYGDDTDALRDGILFVIRDAGGAGAAPEDQFSRINNYDGTTITVDDTLTAAITSLDVIGVSKPSFPLYKCIDSANRAIQSFGTIPLKDTATIVPASSTSEYTWSVAWKYARPFRIDVQGRTNSPNDNQWYPISDYEVESALPGVAGKIIFNTAYLPINHTVRVWYQSLHPTLAAYSDVIDESIHPALARAALTELLAGWFYKQGGGEQPVWREIWNNAKNELINAKEMYPIWQPEQNEPHTFSDLGNNSPSGEFPPSPISWTRS